MIFEPGTVVKNRCFSQEALSEIFDPSMTGVTFINCNLDNVVIPDGNEIIDCSTRRFEVRVDGRDWELDEVGNPVGIINAEIVYRKFGRPEPTPEDLAYWEEVIEVLHGDS